MTVSLPLGPLMLDLAGPRLTDEERELLQHPLVGGVILFKRNFESPAVLQELTFEIHSLRQPPLLIAIDHEGGRVQRFRHGFTVLPPMRALGALWDTDADRALETATAAGYVLAAELRACGIDLSFTPVLDLDHGTSEIIGNRAFHSDPAAVTALAGALIAGLRRAGMANVGKHFPGHGFVAADSHVAIPVDTRPVQALYPDISPYRAHRAMDLAAVMPAHVIYENLDPGPAGFSSYWLRYVLRGELGFDGVIFSDDLSMEGASVAGGIKERADAALAAGCDMVLVCNNPDAARLLLREWRPQHDPVSARRLEKLLPAAPALSLEVLQAEPAYRQALAMLEAVKE
ncbi:MAG: Beta-hexosaminidase [Rhodocyclaceae bacterium]|nr:MAG: beta-N-acetylhexosaminidase [Rhodocyclaceae bacterium]MBV6408240.1 Beta-hexosaminidase [Rhodocyclaceae bacterium]CAG0926984.1 beta-N-acetylhexosaminidase [Rhodocyclaceae bacterium]